MPESEKYRPRVEADTGDEPPSVLPEDETEKGKHKKRIDPDREAKRKALLAEAEREFGDFFRVMKSAFHSYGGTARVEFSCEPGGWYVDLENIRINADPTFFLDRGYTKAEATFAAFHEYEHFRDMVEDPGLYEGLSSRIKERKDVHAAFPKALHRLYNCLDDVLVNRAVMSRWKNGVNAKDSLYPKLFPSADFRGKEGMPSPRHRQFMYALLREAMLPGEPAVVEPEVKEAVEKCRRIFGNDLSRLLSVDKMGRANRAELPSMEPIHRFSAIEAVIEPIFEAFYQQDLIDRKPPPSKGEPGEKGDEKPDGEPGEGDAGDPFGDDPFESANPDPIPFEDAIKHAGRISARIREEKKKDFKETMGVEQKDYDAYLRDVEKVAPYIDKLSAIFDKVIQRRISHRRVLRKRAAEGAILDPRMLATAMAEMKAGHTDPIAMLDYRQKELIRKQPNRIEFTLVCDWSSSMGEGGKAAIQRRLAILFLEAFAKFRDRIEEVNRESHSAVELEVLSEVRVFSSGDEEPKPLSKELTLQQRVKVRKKLVNPAGVTTDEKETFDAIERATFGDEDRVEAIRKGDTKKIILFLTDGESVNKGAVLGRIARMMEITAPPEGFAPSLTVAGLGFGEGKSAKETYAPNGYYAETFDDVIPIFEKFIEGILDEV